MAFGIVPAGEHRIFKTHAALTAEIVLADQVNYVPDVVGFLHRHQFCPLFRERVVQTDRQVAAGAVQEAFQGRQDADGAEGDTLRAPAETPGRRQHVDGLHHRIVIVQRLAHAHENSIGEVFRFVHGQELGQDIGNGQVPVKTLAAGHAKPAAHLAARLGGYAKGLAVRIRNHHRLYRTRLGCFYGEKVFFGSV